MKLLRIIDYFRLQSLSTITILSVNNYKIIPDSSHT